MKTRDAIKRMCETSEIGPVKVSESIGRSRTYVNHILSRGSTPQADTLARIANACGYELLLKGHGETLTIDPD